MLGNESTQFMVFDKDEKRFLETIYQTSLSWDAHVDCAMKYPTIEIARAIMEYIAKRNNKPHLTLLQRTMTTQVVE